MNIGLESLQLFQSSICNSLEDRLNLEINYHVAYEALIDVFNDSDNLQRLLDNIDDLARVTKRYHSNECLLVVHTLTNNELLNCSMEGFFTDAWDKLKKIVKKLFDKVVEFFKWVGKKIKDLFGIKSKVRCKKNSALGKIARKNKKVANLVTTTEGSTQSLVSMEDFNPTVGLTLANLTPLMDAMRENTMRTQVEVTVLNMNHYDSICSEYYRLARWFQNDIVKLANTKTEEAKRQLMQEHEAEMTGAAADSMGSSLNAKIKAIEEGLNNAFEKRQFKSYDEAFEYCVKLAQGERNCAKIASQVEELSKDLAANLSGFEMRAQQADNQKYAQYCVTMYRGLVKMSGTLQQCGTKFSTIMIRAIQDILRSAYSLFNANSLLNAEAGDYIARNDSYDAIEEAEDRNRHAQ